MSDTNNITTSWNNFVSADWSKFISDHNLQSLEEIKSIMGTPSLAGLSEAIVAGEHINSELVSILENDPSEVTAISGFDSAGRLHMGNALVLKQISFLKDKGCKVRLALVDSEAVAVRGLTPDQALEIAEKSMFPTLQEIGFEQESIYIRSRVVGISNIMAKLSQGFDLEEMEKLYGHSLSFAEQYSILFMAADLLRPQIEEGTLHTIALYGIDEAPHIKAINRIATNLGMQPIAGLFNPLIPATSPNQKMSKSLDETGVNISLSDTPDFASEQIERYEVLDTQKCMVLGLRRHFLKGAMNLSEEEICTLQCGECKTQSASAMKAVMARKRDLF